jgi:hypothetical protein
MKLTIGMLKPELMIWLLCFLMSTMPMFIENYIIFCIFKSSGRVEKTTSREALLL